VQPTDFRVWSVFVSLRDAEAARRNERGTGIGHQGLVAEIAGGISQMRSRLIQILTALASIAAIAFAGGASLRGF
jgi:hypothetical protein